MVVTVFFLGVKDESGIGNPPPVPRISFPDGDLTFRWAGKLIIIISVGRCFLNQQLQHNKQKHACTFIG